VNNGLSDSFTKIVTKLDKEMDAQEVKNWTQRIEIVKIMYKDEYHPRVKSDLKKLDKGVVREIYDVH